MFPDDQDASEKRNERQFHAGNNREEYVAFGEKMGIGASTTCKWYAKPDHPDVGIWPRRVLNWYEQERQKELDAKLLDAYRGIQTKSVDPCELHTKDISLADACVTFLGQRDDPPLDLSQHDELIGILDTQEMIKSCDQLSKIFDKPR